MAVQAALYPPQFILNKQFMMTMPTDAADNVYKPQIGNYATDCPLSGADNLLPMYASDVADSVTTAPFPAADDSGLTYSTLPVSRKRPRHSPFPLHHHQIDRSAAFTFLGEDISSKIQQQQLEIDQVIARHMEKVTTEIEQRRKINSRRILATVEERITKRLKSKDEELAKFFRLNWALEEKVKSMSVENQIWRELAQTHEATANALRIDLCQVMDHAVAVHDDYRHRSTAEAEAAAGNSESCCGSNDEERRTLAEQDNGDDDECCTGKKWKRGGCRNCWIKEACVLLLPCRHLCLCTPCASSLKICPICKSSKNITLHVNTS